SCRGCGTFSAVSAAAPPPVLAFAGPIARGGRGDVQDVRPAVPEERTDGPCRLRGPVPARGRTWRRRSWAAGLGGRDDDPAPAVRRARCPRPMTAAPPSPSGRAASPARAGDRRAAAVPWVTARQGRTGE